MYKSWQRRQQVERVAIHTPYLDANAFPSSSIAVSMIQDSQQQWPELGEILVSLTYLPSARRLNLDLLRGKQLLQTNLGGSGKAPSSLFFSISLFYLFFPNK